MTTISTALYKLPNIEVEHSCRITCQWILQWARYNSLWNPLKSSAAAPLIPSCLARSKTFWWSWMVQTLGTSPVLFPWMRLWSLSFFLSFFFNDSLETSKLTTKTHGLNISTACQLKGQWGWKYSISKTQFYFLIFGATLGYLVLL